MLASLSGPCPCEPTPILPTELIKEDLQQGNINKSRVFQDHKRASRDVPLKSKATWQAHLSAPAAALRDATPVRDAQPPANPQLSGGPQSLLGSFYCKTVLNVYNWQGDEPRGNWADNGPPRSSQFLQPGT